jgi:hypothetical protein
LQPPAPLRGWLLRARNRPAMSRHADSPCSFRDFSFILRTAMEVKRASARCPENRSGSCCLCIRAHFLSMDQTHLGRTFIASVRRRWLFQTPAQRPDQSSVFVPPSRGSPAFRRLGGTGSYGIFCWTAKSTPFEAIFPSWTSPVRIRSPAP